MYLVKHNQNLDKLFSLGSIKHIKITRKLHTGSERQFSFLCMTLTLERIKKSYFISGIAHLTPFDHLCQHIGLSVGPDE